MLYYRYGIKQVIMKDKPKAKSATSLNVKAINQN